MQKRFRNIVLSIWNQIAFSLLMAILISSCENDIKTVTYYTKPTDVSLETAENVEIIYSELGRPLAKLNAPLLNHYLGTKPRIEMPKGIKVQFYDSLKNVQSELRANSAIRYEEEQKMEARNNVVIINREGDVLNTEHLVWDEKREKIYSDIFVKITTDDEILFGDGFESDQYFEHYEIKKLRGTISLKQ